MLIIKDSSFLKSVARPEDRPSPPRPEFAFAGRSNVGKSSLINCLLNRQNIAKVSKNPGKTRNINYFLINQQFYLVDLPGYGYAKVSIQEKKRWQKLIERFLLNNNQLRLLFVLIDAKVGLKDSDVQLLEWLLYEGIHFHLVLTKSDKINKNLQKSRKNEIGSLLPENVVNQPTLFSAKTSSGRLELLEIISRHLNGMSHTIE